MGIRIESNDDLERCQNDIDFCYICGRKLIEPLRKPRATSLEHVIPRSLLGSGVDGCRALKLRVHRECDDRSKMRDDEIVAVFQRFAQNPSRELRTQERNALAVLAQSRFFEAQSGRELPLLPVRRMCNAVAVWVKGMHTALYREPLGSRVDACPPSNSGAIPPLGSVIDYSDVFDQAVRSAFRYESIKMIVETALVHGHADEVIAWNRSVRYAATWLDQRRATKGSFPWQCAWLLLHPGVDQLSRQLCGELRCWWGVYGAISPPRFASRLSFRDIQQRGTRDPDFLHRFHHVRRNLSTDE